MAETETHKPRWARRIILTALAVILLLILAILALRVYITTEPGARFVERQINSRSFGPIKAVNISGLSGDPLKDFSVSKIEIQDKEGVWLNAENMTMRWSPFALARRHLKIQRLNVSKVNALRRPSLETTPSPDAEPFIVSVPDFELSKLTLHDALIGLRADFRVTGGLLASGGKTSAKFDAVRTDIQGDRFQANFTHSQEGDIDGTFDIRAKANGPLAQLIRAPENKDVSGSGNIVGSQDRGAGQFKVTFDETNAANGELSWSEKAAQLKTDIDIAQWDIFETAAQRVGSKLNITASADLKGGITTLSEAPFQLNIKAPKLTVQASGVLPEEGLIPSRAKFTLNTQSLSDLAILPEGYQGGKGTITGTIANESNIAFDGQIDLYALTSPYGRAARLYGPLSARKSGDDTYNYNGTLNLLGLSLTQDLPVEIGQSAKLTSSGTFNLNSQRLDFEDTNLVSGPSDITAKGGLGWSPLAYDITGSAVTSVLAQGSIPAGALDVDYNIRQTELSTAALSADGQFKPNDPLAGPLGVLIGKALTFKTRMSPIDGGIEISEARLNGDNIRAAIEGRFSDSYNLSGEAMLASSLPLGSATLGENTDLSFKLLGPKNNPDLRLEASSSEVIIGGQTLASPRLRLEATDILKAPKGPLQFEAETEYGDLVASTQFASKPGVYTAEDIIVKLGELTARGDISLAESKLATGQLTLDLPQEGERFAKASLELSPLGTQQGISLSIDAKDVALQQYEFDIITAKAEGTLAALTGQIKTKGRRNISLLSRGFELGTPFTFSRNDDNLLKLQLSPEGKYGDIALGSSEPVAASLKNGAITLNAPLTLSGQPVTLDYVKENSSETFKLQASNLPITLIPMPGNLADTRGRAAIDLNLQSNGSSVSGGGKVNLTDWRGFDMKRESGINADAVLTMDGSRAELTLEGRASSGFAINGNAQFGLNNANNLIALRLNDTAPVSGDFNMSGAAASILGLVTPSDAELGGDLTASLKLSGTANAPLINGQASGQKIRFEAPELGTRIRNGRFSTNFQNDRFSVTDVFLQDSSKGTLSGGGEFTLGELGRPLGSLNISAKKFRALDRRDVQGVVSGELIYESRQEDAELTGDIRLNEAEVKQFVTGGTSVIEIDVEEVNRPDAISSIKFQEKTVPIKLNINVTAPREIYVRSRGLDVELSVDMEITGAIDNPSFKGEAEVVRGGYKLAGKTLQFSEGSIKFDGPLPDAKLSLLAETETTDITAQVEITGTVEKPNIELTSTPERPQDEILSVLLFGRSATELSTIEAAQLAGALAQFSGSGAGFDLLGGLRDAFGIGQLSVGFAEDGTALISGGRYLAKNVYLQVFSGAGQDQTGAIIEWEIRKNLSLRSRLQADNDQAFSLKYKRDF